MTEENKKTILLADDDTVLRKMYATKLTREGYDVVSVGDGKEAQEKIKEQNVDIAIIDIMMPHISGTEFLEALRGMDKYKNLPVVVMSNLSHKEEKEKAQKLGVKEFVVKAELTPSALVEKIQKYLG